MIFPPFVERKLWDADLLRSIMIIYDFRISILIDLNKIIIYLRPIAFVLPDECYSPFFMVNCVSIF